jgi:hypothetical protein
MENTKVVVMGPADVAAMRKAHKEAEAAYYQAKVGALEFVAQEMKTTGEWYSAAELASMTGLSSNEIARQLCGVYARASHEAGIQYGEVQTTERHNELKFVRVMQDGSIDPNQTMTVVRKQIVYKMRPDCSAKTRR